MNSISTHTNVDINTEGDFKTTKFIEIEKHNLLVGKSIEFLTQTKQYRLEKFNKLINNIMNTKQYVKL